MKLKIQFALVVFVWQVLLGSARMVPQATVEARDLPIDQDTRLKMLALSGASAHTGPRQKNPRVSAVGLDPTVLVILEQQRKYWDRSHASSRKSAQGRQLTDGSFFSSGAPAAAFSMPSCPNPMIKTVNGRPRGVVFTPRLGDNHLRIEGCGFGAEDGQVQLEFEGQDLSQGILPQSTSLQLDGRGTWTDNQIDVHLDPRLSGLPDMAASLVVRRADGRRIQLPGCRFIAVRGEATPMKKVPASWVKLSATTTGLVPLRQLEYLSPPTQGAEVPDHATGFSALVVRSDLDAFASGSDIYDFSELNPGWVVESVQIQSYSVSCPGDVMRTSQSGNWNTNFDIHGFTVTWASSACFSFIPPMFRFSIGSSEYAVKVWVTGPVGTEPFWADVARRKQDQK